MLLAICDTMVPFSEETERLARYCLEASQEAIYR